jgi:hypothetical protein
MLYVGTRHGMPERATPDLIVEPVEQARVGVAQWFSQPVVQFVGAHTGCSCGFPSVVASETIEYYDGMLGDPNDRADDLRSVQALIEIIRAALQEVQLVELYPVWAGDEGAPPKGIIRWSLEDLAADRFFFNEQFMHVVQRAGRGRPTRG